MPSRRREPQDRHSLKQRPAPGHGGRLGALLPGHHQAGAAAGSARSIAAQLGRSPSTISRELANNADPTTGRYHPLQAHRRAEQRRARRTPSKLERQPELGAFVQQCLGKRWGPEQISRRCL